MEQDVKYELILNKLPEDLAVKQVHAVLLTRDGRVLLRYKNGEARLVGGKPEDSDNSWEDTLRREALEEANCEIDKVDYLGYQKVTEVGLAKYAQVRMVARISQIGTALPDPDRDGNWIYGRVLAPVEIARQELGKSFGKIGEDLLKRALEIAREKEYFTELPSQEYETLNVESRDNDYFSL